MKKIHTLTLSKYSSPIYLLRKFKKNILGSAKASIVLIVAIALFSVSAFGQSTFNIANGNWNVATNWTPNGVPSGTTAIIIPAGSTANMSSGDSYTGSGAITLGGTLSVPSGATFKPTGILSMTANSATLSGGGTVQLTTLTVNSANTTDIVSITNSTAAAPVMIGIGNSTGTINLNNGILKLTGSTIAITKTAVINVTSPSNFANSADGTGIDADTDGGTFSLIGGSGGTTTVNGAAAFYNINTATGGNVVLALSSASNVNSRVDGIFGLTGTAANQFHASGNPIIWGSLSTLYLSGNGQGGNTGNFLPALWTTTGTIGVTPGYPNNVTLTNFGTSQGNNYGWQQNAALNGIAGVLTIGDIGGSSIGQINFGGLTNFSCGGFVLENGSRFGAPTNTVTVSGSWYDSSAVANNIGFVNNNGTVAFSGSSNQVIGGSVATPFNNLTINGTSSLMVKLNQPVTMAATGILTLTSGIVDATTNILSVTNTSATNAISGGSAASYVSGQLQWSLSAASANYLFPVGAGTSTYLPLTLNKTAISANTITVQAYDVSSNGTTDGTLSSLSQTEYWTLAASSNISGGYGVSVTRPTAVDPYIYVSDSIGGVGNHYTSLGGTASGNSVNNSNPIGAGSIFYIALGAPPIVSTLPATSLTTTSATLNGSFNTNGSSLPISFNYGLTTSYGTLVTAIVSPLTSNSSTPDSAFITGLTANTLYHYMATDGVNSGNDQIFITAPNPPIVGAPSSPTIDGFTANWSAPAVPGTAPYAYTVQVSTDPTFATGVTTQSGISSGTTSFVFTTLASATTYYYRVEAMNTTANSTWSATSTGIATDIFPTQPCTTGTGSTTSTGAIAKALTLPVIDGQVDPVWDGVPANNISILSVGGPNNNTQKTWKAMWSSDSLYFLVQVTDPTLISQKIGIPGGGTSVAVPGATQGTSNNYYDFDGVELTLDPDYSHGTGYDQVNDVQFRFNLGATNVSGQSSGTGNQFTAPPSIFNSVYQKIDFKVVVSPGGYTVEAAIPLDPGIDSLKAGGYFAPTNGQNIGLEVQVNDATTASGRTAQYSWFNNAQTPYSDPSTFAEATLTSCPIPPTVILPTVTNITDSSATLGATVTSSGDAALTANGTGYTANPLTTGTENALAASTVVTPPSAFTTPRISLAPQTKYYFLGYANNANSETGVSNVDSFYTLSALPTEKTVITPNSCSQVTLNWTAINFPSADSATQTGYILLRSISPAFPSTTGIITRVATTQSALASGTTLVTTITSGTTLTYVDATAVAGTTYNYLLVPFTSDGVPADSTYNYFVTGAANRSTGLGTGLSVPTVSVTQPTCAVATGTIAVSNPSTGVTYSFDGGTTYINNSSIDTTAGTYKVQVETTAGCVSADTSVTVTIQPATPVVKVTSDSLTISVGSTVTLTGAPAGGTYLWSVTPTTELSSTSQSQITSTPTQAGKYVYKLTVTTDANCVGSDSVPVTVNPSLLCPLNPPKVFTPNGDGFNDTWKIFAGCSTNNVVNVYNRWGSLVYHNDVYDNSNAWDGTYKGDKLPDGTYYYVILSTQNGRTYTLTGNVTILR